MTSDQRVTRQLLRWRAVAIVADNARAYLALNVAMYGLFLAGFIVGLTFPQLSRAQVTRLDDNGTPIWAFRAGGPRDDDALALVADGKIPRSPDHDAR